MSPLFLSVPILFPIIGGALLPLLRNRSVAALRVCSEIIVVLTSILVWAGLFSVHGESAQIYSFAKGFTIELSLDGSSAFFAGMISIMWPLIMLYAFEYMKETSRQASFFAFFVMTYGVTLGVAFSANILTLYVFYEMLSLVTIPLVIYYKDHESSYAGRKYAAYTIGGAALAFFAVILTTVYGDADGFAFGGTMSPDEGEYTIMQIAYLFGFFGFGVKAAVFPFHNWLPTASVAPTPVTSLLHAVAVVNSGIFAVIRLTWFVFDPQYLAGTPAQIAALMTAAFTLVFAAVLAVRERHFKRRLACSTVSNLSYMLFGVLLLTPDGLVAGFAHMLFHSVIKMNLFLCAGAFMHVTGRSYIYEVSGAGRRMPATFTIYTVSALSLTGIPLLSGFVSKWRLIAAGVAGGSIWSLIGVISLIVSAFLCAIYTLSVSVRAFFPAVERDLYTGSERHDAPALMLIPMTFFAAADIALGVFSGPVIAFFEKIAAGLL